MGVTNKFINGTIKGTVRMITKKPKIPIMFLVFRFHLFFEEKLDDDNKSSQTIKTNSNELVHMLYEMKTNKKKKKRCENVKFDNMVYRTNIKYKLVNILCLFFPVKMNT